MSCGKLPEAELTLPRATVTKIIKEMLPKDLRCSNETRDLVMECCCEFIHQISSQANEICSRDGKKTIAPEHVIKALEELEFFSYVASAKAAHEKHKADIRDKPKCTNKLVNSGMSQEEMLRQQQELFALARAKSQDSD